MQAKHVVFYLTRNERFGIPQISGTQSEVEQYLNQTQGILYRIPTTLYPDEDRVMNIYGVKMLFRYVRGYILVRNFSSAFNRFLYTQKQNGFFSLPIYPAFDDPYIARFVMSIDYNGHQENLWIGLKR
ncbi:MAG: hypothetical protein ACP5S8_08360 [Hydrogenobaculum sp.]